MDEMKRALTALEQEFREAPTLFFTEHDLASRVYHLVQEQLGYARTEAADGSLHYLVHHEYPTPFRCDMSRYGFVVMDEETRTPRGGKYRRGHYDLVVFNPAFIERSALEVIRGQKYGLLMSELPGIMKALDQPPVLAGVEFAYNRVPFASAAHGERWCRLVLQDYAKLEASRRWRGQPFMRDAFLVAFSGYHDERVEEMLHRRSGERTGLKYCTPSCTGVQ